MFDPEPYLLTETEDKIIDDILTVFNKNGLTSASCRKVWPRACPPWSEEDEHPDANNRRHSIVARIRNLSYQITLPSQLASPLGSAA
jgi:hypothetical protein